MMALKVRDMDITPRPLRGIPARIEEAYDFVEQEKTKAINYQDNSIII